MTAPVHPGGERWIVDGGDGCTTEFDTEAEAVAYADACIQDWCDEGWMEEVDNIFVARLTHRSQRHVVAVQGEVSEEEWERVTHGGSGFSEWWEYEIEPLAPTPQAPTVDSVPDAVKLLADLANDGGTESIPSVDVCGFCWDSECDGIGCIANLDPDCADDHPKIERLHALLRAGHALRAAAGVDWNDERDAAATGCGYYPATPSPVQDSERPDTDLTLPERAVERILIQDQDQPFYLVARTIVAALAPLAARPTPEGDERSIRFYVDRDAEPSTLCDHLCGEDSSGRYVLAAIPRDVADELMRQLAAATPEGDQG